MKQLLLSLSLFLLALPSFGQFGTCEADATFADSMAGVYPLPYDAVLNPTGGIPDSACLNKFFDFTFNAVVSDTLTLDIGAFPLDSLVLNTTGAIQGLPDGFEYACDPPNCVFVKSTVGCVVVYGKTEDQAALGDNEMTISATVFSQGFPIPLTFPNPALFPGTYSLYVHPEDYPNCKVSPVSTSEVPSPIGSIRNIPNPFNGLTTIELVSSKSDQFRFTVTDLFGKEVYHSDLQILEGENQLEFDAQQLPTGIYLYSFRNGESVITRKMVVQR